jgi:hypothetical protein
MSIEPMDAGFDERGSDSFEAMQAEGPAGGWQPGQGVGQPGTVFTAERTGEWEVGEHIEKGAYGSVHKVRSAVTRAGLGAAPPPPAPPSLLSSQRCLQTLSDLAVVGCAAWGASSLAGPPHCNDGGGGGGGGWQLRNQRTGELAAVKIIPIPAPSDHERSLKLQRELQIAQQLQRHPNVVGWIDLVMRPNACNEVAIIWEYAQGGDARRLLDRGALPEPLVGERACLPSAQQQPTRGRSGWILHLCRACCTCRATDGWARSPGGTAAAAAAAAAAAGALGVQADHRRAGPLPWPGGVPPRPQARELGAGVSGGWWGWWGWQPCHASQPADRQMSQTHVVGHTVPGKGSPSRHGRSSAANADASWRRWRLPARVLMLRACVRACVRWALSSRGGQGGEGADDQDREPGVFILESVPC